MNFDEVKHEYTHDGITYTSVTQILKKYGLSADYANIPKSILEKAANRGKAVHKGLELYIGGDQSMLGLLTEVDLFHNYVIARNINLKSAKAEEIVYDTHYEVAGTVDFQYIDGIDNVIADFKTTSSLHLDAVSWQLSIYNYLVSKGDLMTYYFNKLKVFHMVNGRLYVKDIHTIDFDAVKSLLEAHKRRDPVFNYTKPNRIMSDAQEKLIEQILIERESYQGAIDKLSSELNTVLTEIKDNMLKQKEYEHKTPVFKIRYNSPQHRKSLNKTKVVELINKYNLDIKDFENQTITKDGITVRLLKVGDTDGDDD